MLQLSGGLPKITMLVTLQTFWGTETNVAHEIFKISVAMGPGQMLVVSCCIPVSLFTCKTGFIYFFLVESATLTNETCMLK